MINHISRRDFLKVCGSVTGGLLIGTTISSCSDTTKVEASKLQPGVWLSIDVSGVITVIVSKMEMGQDIDSSIAMIVAEELSISPSSINLKPAEVSYKYGSMMTAGSSSIRQLWQPLKRTSAIARQLLLNAAANTWQVSVGDCTIKDLFVYHSASKRKLSFAELVTAASNLEISEDILNQTHDDRQHWKSSEEKGSTKVHHVTGAQEYGVDVEVPNLHYAAIKQAPFIGSSLISIEYPDLSEYPHIQGVYQFAGYIAVVADNHWRAQKFLERVKAQWSKPRDPSLSSSNIRKHCAALLEKTGQMAVQKGKLADESLENQVSLVFETAYQAHACMEPMNCTAYVQSDKCEIWVPTQDPQGVVNVVSKKIANRLTNLLIKVRRFAGFPQDNDNIIVHHLPMGGGFGRRLEHDFVIQAVEISQASQKPVKLSWSREEDIRHDFYKPYTLQRISASYDKQKQVIAMFKHSLVGPVNWLSYSASDDFLYQNSYFSLDFHLYNPGVPVGFWRSVSEFHKVFAYETMVDQLAKLAAKDALSFRLSSLKPENSRMKSLVQLAINNSGISTAEQTKAYGTAINKAYDSFIALIAFIEMIGDQVHVKDIYCAVDCGLVVNEKAVIKQIKGAIIFGLSAIRSEISIESAQVVESNFHDFPLLEFNEVPEIRVELVDSTRSPGGIGELAVPLVAPAISNAIFFATGLPVTKLPIKNVTFSPSNG